MVAVPNFYQHQYWGSNEGVETGNTFKYKLQNASGANNRMSLFLNYAFSASRTITITDDAGNTWPSSPIFKTDDTTNNITSAYFEVLNSIGGTKVITVIFDTAILGVQASYSEWYNTATSGADDGNASANLVITPNIASGSFTTTAAGDLILHWGIDTGNGNNYGDGSTFTGITASSGGYTLLQADFRLGGFLEYLVQTTAGATNPSATISGATGDSYNSLTIALKASATPSGTQRPSGIFTVGVFHTTIPSAAAANHTTQFPTFGNLFVVETAQSPAQTKMNTVSDSVNSGWTVINTAGFPQFAYKQSNPTPSSSMVVTVNNTDGGAGIMHLVFQDVQGAASSAFDIAATASGGSASGNIPNAPTIMPSTANGLIIASMNLLTGPPDTMPLPSGGVLLSLYHTGMTDLNPSDFGDGYGLYYNLTATSVSFEWHDTAATTGWSSTALAFKAAVLAFDTPTVPSGRTWVPQWNADRNLLLHRRAGPEFSLAFETNQHYQPRYFPAQWNPDKRLFQNIPGDLGSAAVANPHWFGVPWPLQWQLQVSLWRTTAQDFSGSAVETNPHWLGRSWPAVWLPAAALSRAAALDVPVIQVDTPVYTVPRSFPPQWLTDRSLMQKTAQDFSVLAVETNVLFVPRTWPAQWSLQASLLRGTAQDFSSLPPATQPVYARYGAAHGIGALSAIPGEIPS